MTLIVTLALVVPVFVLWTAIHELSHLAAARLTVDAELVWMRLYPHVDTVAGFRWGAVKYRYRERGPTDREQALISFAPRLPDLVAALAFPALGALPLTGTAFAVASLVLGAGLVDLGNGSLGLGEHSDLRRGAAALGRSPWLFRVAGALVLALSAGSWLALSLDQLRGLL
jgi:hypothetical protein